MTELLETCAKKYKEMDASKKKQFRKNQRKKYNFVGCQGKCGPGKIHEVILVEISMLNITR